MKTSFIKTMFSVPPLKPLLDKQCINPECKKAFQTIYPRQIYCSKQCGNRMKYLREDSKEASRYKRYYLKKCKELKHYQAKYYHLNQEEVYKKEKERMQQDKFRLKRNERARKYREMKRINKMLKGGIEN